MERNSWIRSGIFVTNFLYLYFVKGRQKYFFYYRICDCQTRFSRLWFQAMDGLDVQPVDWRKIKSYQLIFFLHKTAFHFVRKAVLCEIKRNTNFTSKYCAHQVKNISTLKLYSTYTEQNNYHLFCAKKAKLDRHNYVSTREFYRTVLSEIDLITYSNKDIFFNKLHINLQFFPQKFKSKSILYT